MSKFETIAHPQQLGNEFSGCWAVRRNLSFFDLFNVDDLVHSNNLLTHTHTHTHTHNRHTYCLSLTLIFFFIVRMRDALPLIYSERVCHTLSFLLSHACFLTRMPYNSNLSRDLNT